MKQLRNFHKFSILVLILICLFTTRLSEANQYFVLHSPAGELSTFLSQKSKMGSSMECASWCALRNDCLAYSYGQTNGSCKIGTNVTSSAVMSGSALYYKMKELSMLANNGPCLANIECTGYPTMACTYGICQCPSGWYASANSTSCLKSGAGKSGDPCTLSTQCSGYPTMTCNATSAKCSCPTAGFIVSNDLARCLPTDVLANGVCERSDQCTDYPAMTCTNAECQCNPGMVASFDRAVCLPVKYYGETCLDSTQCPDLCVTGLCECPATDTVPAFVQPPATCLNIGFTQVDISDGLAYSLSYPDPRDGTPYGPDLNLAWCVQTTTESRVRAEIAFWDLEGERRDFIELHDGCDFTNTSAFHIFDKWYGNWVNLTWAKTTTSNMMGIDFETDSTVQLTGFTLTLTTVAP